jgi:hypothetical protein
VQSDGHPVGFELNRTLRLQGQTPLIGRANAEDGPFAPAHGWPKHRIVVQLAAAASSIAQAAPDRAAAKTGRARLTRSIAFWDFIHVRV